MAAITATVDGRTETWKDKKRWIWPVALLVPMLPFGAYREAERWGLDLFWFLGHPEVYIIILPALGLTSEIISVNARKPIFGYRAMVTSILAIGFLSFIVWGHHMFMTGMNPFLGSVFVFTTLLIAIPSAVKAFNYITTLWKGNLQFTPAMLFACVNSSR